jgi:hypothetical protein
MRHKGNLTGFVVIIVGILLLLNNLDLIELSWERLWPVLPLALGVCFLIQFAQNRDKGILIPATLFTGVGIFFFMFTTGVFPWDAMGDWWPIFPLLLGLGFFFAYLADMRDSGLLIPATILLTVGGVFLARNNPVTRGYLKYWPVVLVIAGLFMFFGNMFPEKEAPMSKGEHPEEPKDGPVNG